MADKDNNVEVKMLVRSGQTEDSQYFDYRPSFFGDIVRVEWDLDTMEAALASDAAEYLINHGYAERLSPEPEPAEPPLVVEEPLVVEHNEVPEPSLQAPPAVEEKEVHASSGGKQKKKEKTK